MEFKRITRQGKQRLALDVTLRSDSAPRHIPVASEPNRAQLARPSLNNTDTTNGAATQDNARFTRTRRFLVGKKVIIGIITVLIVIVAGTTSLTHKYNTEKNSASATASNRPVGNPEYQTVLPEGKSIDELGDWKRVSPPEGDPVFAYIDKIDDVTVSVSQQPIPKSLKGNAEEQIAELAKKFNATSRIDADGTKVYVGTSAKGPQSAILTKNNLLILIKSQEKINDISWAKYAKSLN